MKQENDTIDFAKRHSFQGKSCCLKRLFRVVFLYIVPRMKDTNVVQ